MNPYPDHAPEFTFGQAITRQPIGMWEILYIDVICFFQTDTNRWVYNDGYDYFINEDQAVLIEE